MWGVMRLGGSRNRLDIYFVCAQKLKKIIASSMAKWFVNYLVFGSKIILFASPQKHHPRPIQIHVATSSRRWSTTKSP